MDDAPAAAEEAPPNGWGMGPSADWMRNSRLRFNKEGTKTFSTLQLSPGEPLLLVFGGASVSDMLRNWALHAQKIGMTYVVTCMDEKLFNLADEYGLPGAIFSDEASGRVTTRWKYFRMDPKAFMTMGILKAQFFIAFLRAGFDILCADLDVLWLRPPTPYLNGEVASSQLLGFADVVVSSDVTNGLADTDARWWGMQQEMNTGMLLLRSSPGSVAVCEAWVARMQQEMVSISKLPPNMLQWWSNDQTFFNEVIHRSQKLQADLKSLNANNVAAASAVLRQHTTLPQRRSKLDETLARMDTLRAGRSRDFVETRNLVFRALSRPGKPAQTFSIGTFPFEVFASGHTFFTQSLQQRLGIQPVAVHTTFQFGDTAEFAWGKRSRLRERLMWLVDNESYYARRGPGPDPSELDYSGFLALDGDLVDLHAPLIRDEASASVKLEGGEPFLAASLKARGDVFQMREGDPNKHLILDSFQRRLVHNALALARAMRRKLIFPKLQCWSDRYWNTLVNGRFPDVRPENHPLPFHCPFDHLYDLDKWVHSDAPFREYSFLDNPRVRAEDKQDSVRLVVRGAKPEPAAEARVVTLDTGADYKQAADAVAEKGWNDAYVVKVGARSLELLCEHLGSAEENSKFNKVMHRVLGIAEQVRFCDAYVNRNYNGRQDDRNNPINCTWGFHRPPPLPESGILGLGGDSQTCETDASKIIAARLKEPERTWQNFRNERWSTRDRPGYLYRQYM